MIENAPLYSNNPAEDPTSAGGRFSYLTPSAKLLLTVSFAFVLYMAVGLGSDIIVSNSYGVSGSEMIRDMDGFLEEHGTNLNLYRLMQILSTILIFGLSSLLASYLFTGRAMGMFEFSKSANKASILYIPAIILLAFPVIALIYSYISQLPVPESLSGIEESLEKFTMALLSDEKISIFLINFIMIAILPALFEEMLFRGVIQNLMIRSFNNPHTGILMSGLMFGFIHGQIFKFLPIAVLGVLLGYLYWWTKNLWFPIAAHFLHNGIQVVLYFMIAKGWTKMDVESTEMLPPVQTALSAVLFVGVMYLFYNANRKTADAST